MKEASDKAEVLFTSLLQNMPTAIAYQKILTGKKGKPVDCVFLDVNKAFEKLVKLNRKSIIGKKATELFPSIKESMFDWIGFYGNVAVTQKDVIFEQYMQDLKSWYLVAVHSDKKEYFSTIYIDITKRKEAEESLRKAYATLKETQDQLIQTEKMHVVGRLASGVAHEVKNPLAIILQGAGYLSNKLKNQDEGVKFVLESIIDAVRRATGIIDDLLNFSRLSKMELKKESLTSIIENSLLLVKNSINENNIRVIKNFENVKKIDLDKNRIQQVFLNIFVNAIQAMSKTHGNELRIKVYAKKVDKKDKAIVEIEDTGTGIPDDILSKVFDPFFTTKRDDKGTGLGLSITKNIVELHGAEIDIKNRTDRKGTRVQLSFKM